MISGTKVTIGGTDYIVPPLNLRLYFTHEKEIETLMHPADHTNHEYLAAAQTLVVASIQRNYPDFTNDLFLDVGYPDVPELVAAIFSKAGFSNRPLESAAAPISPSPVVS